MAEKESSTEPGSLGDSSPDSSRLQVFISYRRNDSDYPTGRLYDSLKPVFGDGLFMDVDDIGPGLDFVREIEEAVGRCDVLLAVVGKKWLSTRDPRRHQRRLDNPEDFVRLEIEAALRRDVRVIPVLIDDTTMPSSPDLPDSLKPFARRNAVRLTHASWHRDVSALLRALEQVRPGGSGTNPSGHVSDEVFPTAPSTLEAEGRGERTEVRQPDLLVPIAIPIPAGNFMMGQGTLADLPMFAIGKYPVTNTEFEHYVRSTGARPPKHWGASSAPAEIADHPVTWVSWERAQAYCSWLATRTGKPYRLPSGMEWEKAARGTDGRRFPWGNQFDATRCQYRRRSTASVTAHEPGGDSPYGVSDMTGNVREWVTSSVEPDDPQRYRMRGGGREAHSEKSLECSYEEELWDGAAKATTGFRIAVAP